MRTTAALAVACVANGAWVDPPGWRDAPNRDRAAEFLARLRHDAYDDYVTELGWPNATTRRGHRVRGWTNVGGIRSALEPLAQGELGRDVVTVIEVGAWIGGSANAIADRLKEAPALQKAKLRVVSVDTWLGAPEFWGECCINAPDRGGGLRRVRGYPTVFHTCALSPPQPPSLPAPPSLPPAPPQMPLPSSGSPEISGFAVTETCHRHFPSRDSRLQPCCATGT